ncbi:MAG: helix-turn-helix domain-containing protein [Nitrosopumilaceae archaeon]
MKNSISTLVQAYGNEKDAKVKDRMFLVKRVMADGEIPSHVAEQIGKVRSWSYKWLERFEEEGIDGLKDKQRSGRPTSISKQKILKIKQQLSENPSGWTGKQVIELIYKKSGVRYHEVHVYRLLHQWGFAPKVAAKRFVNSAPAKEKLQFKKNPDTT